MRLTVVWTSMKKRYYQQRILGDIWTTFISLPKKLYYTAMWTLIYKNKFHKYMSYTLILGSWLTKISRLNSNSILLANLNIILT